MHSVYYRRFHGHVRENSLIHRHRFHAKLFEARAAPSLLAANAPTVTLSGSEGAADKKMSVPQRSGSIQGIPDGCEDSHAAFNVPGVLSDPKNFLVLTFPYSRTARRKRDGGKDRARSRTRPNTSSLASAN